MKKGAICVMIASICFLFPISAYSKGPQNPLKTPYGKFDKAATGCYNDLVQLEGIVGNFMGEVESRANPIRRTKKKIEGMRNAQITVPTLKRALKRHQGWGGDLQELLSEMVKTSKSANKKCKGLIKGLNNGINYIPDDTEITK